MAMLNNQMAYNFMTFHIGNVIIPTDFHSIIFQRGRVETTKQQFSLHVYTISKDFGSVNITGVGLKLGQADFTSWSSIIIIIILFAYNGHFQTHLDRSAFNGRFLNPVRAAAQISSGTRGTGTLIRHHCCSVLGHGISAIQSWKKTHQPQFLMEITR